MPSLGGATGGEKLPSDPTKNALKCVLSVRLISYLLESVDSSDTDITEGFVRGKIKDYNTVSRWIRNVVNSMVWNESVCADDIVSDTLSKLFVNLKEGRFRQDSSLKTYVQSIARFTTIDTIRSHRRATGYAFRARLEESDAEDPLEVFENEHELYVVDRILNVIDQNCIVLWKMICLEGLTYKEIASRIGLSEGAVKTRVSRCKDKALALRRKME